MEAALRTAVETITGKEFMKMFREMKGLPDPEEENTKGEALEETTVEAIDEAAEGREIVQGDSNQ